MVDIIKNYKKRIRILFLSPYIPFPPDDGLKLRAFHIIKEMLRLNYDVSILCFADADDYKYINKFKEEFDIDVTAIPFEKRSPSKLKRIYLSFFSQYPFMITYYKDKSLFKKSLIEFNKENFDLVYVYDPTMVLYGLDLDMLKILDSVDCQSDSAKNGFNIAKNPIHKIYWYLNYIKWKKVEKKLYVLYDKILTTANRDEISLKSVGGLNVSAIGNGIDYSYFRPLNLTKIPYSLLFIGNMECFSNADAISYFINDVYPLIQQEIPNVQLLVIGKAPKELNKFNEEKNIHFLGYVNDVRTYIDKCKIVISPVKMATGIQTKVLAAMSMNKPIVSTNRAVGDIKNFIDKNDILIADDKYKFAQKIIQLFKNEELINTVGKNGRKIVKENFSWNSTGNKLDSIIKELLKNI